MAADPNFLRLTAYQDQNRAHGRAWFNGATAAERMAVLECILREQEDPLLALVSRLAMVAFVDFIMAEAKERGITE